MRGNQTARRFGLTAATAFTCGVSAVAPALASAVTLSADRECYRPGQPTLITGEGYTPHGEIELRLNLLGAGGGKGFQVFATDADGAGKIAVSLTARPLPPRESPATVVLAATDELHAGLGPPPLVSTQWQLENFDAFVSPWNKGIGTPRGRAQYLMSGFTLETGRTVYAHYIFKGKLRKTVTVGRLTGPCGELSKRAKQFPFRPVAAGIWSIKVDTSRRYPNDSVGRMYRRVRVSHALG